MSSFLTIQSQGLSADVLSVAIHPQFNTIISLCVLGNKSSLEGLWANLCMNHPFSLSGYPNARWPQSKTLTLRPIRYQWPNSTISTMLWIPEHACPKFLTPEHPAYLLLAHPPTTEPPPTFFALLNTLLSCPLHHQWADPLWQWGLEAEWITPLIGHHMVGWEIAPSRDECIRWIQQSLRQGTLPIPQAA